MSDRKNLRVEPLPIRNRPDESNYDHYLGTAGQSLPTGWGDSWSAAAELTEEDLIGGRMDRSAEMAAAVRLKEEKLSAEQLNQLYPYMEVPFTRPVAKNVAELLAQRARRRQELQDIINRGPQGLLPGTMRFASSVFEAIQDPYELAAGFATGAALTSFARSARIAYLASTKPTAWQSVRAATTDAFVGSAVLEPFTMAAAQQNMRQYGASDSFYNVAASSVAWGVGVGAWRVGIRGVSEASRYLRGVDPNLEESAMRSAQGAVASDRNPLVGDIVDAASRRLHGPGISRETPSWTYTPIRNAQDLAARQGRLFAASPDPRSEYFSGTRGFIEDDFGSNGTYFTDSDRVASGIAHNPETNQSGTVHLFDIDTNDLNLLDLEAKPEGRAREIVEPFIRAMFPEKRAKWLLKHGSLRQVYNAARGLAADGVMDDAIDRLNLRFAQEGFHGLRFEGGARGKGGAKSGQHNVFMMFDPSDLPDKKMRMRERFATSPDPRQAGSALSVEDARAMAERAHAIYNHTLFDQDDYEEIVSVIKGPEPKTKTIADVNGEADAVLNGVSLRESLGDIDPEVKKRIEKIVKKAADGELEDRVAQNALACMSGGLL